MNSSIVKKDNFNNFIWIAGPRLQNAERNAPVMVDLDESIILS